MTDPLGKPWPPGFTYASPYIRSEATFTAYDVDGNQLGEPLETHGLIPFEFEDLTQPAVQAEVFRLTAMGFEELAISKEEINQQNGETHTA